MPNICRALGLNPRNTPPPQNELFICHMCWHINSGKHQLTKGWVESILFSEMPFLQKDWHWGLIYLTVSYTLSQNCTAGWPLTPDSTLQQCGLLLLHLFLQHNQKRISLSCRNVIEYLWGNKNWVYLLMQINTLLSKEFYFY